MRIKRVVIDVFIPDGRAMPYISVQDSENNRYDFDIVDQQFIYDRGKMIEPKYDSATKEDEGIQRD